MNGIVRGPGSGRRVKRGTIALVAALCVSAASSGAARWRIADPQIGYTPLVTVRGQVARLAEPSLPPDARIAPDDFVAAATDEESLAQLSQNYRPNPAIWRISDRDTTIYLFGTIHVLPPGFAWRNAAVDRIVTEADTLILESVDDGRAAPAPPGAAPLPPLAARVSADHRAALDRFTATLDPAAAAALDGLPTWIAAVAIGFVRDFRAGEIPGPGADDWLQGYFRARGKPVVAIEDEQDMLARVNAVPPGDQQAMLAAALDAPRRSRADLRAATHAWAKGEIGPGSALIFDLASSTGTGAFTTPLVNDRNRAWADVLVTRLRTPGTVLVAAGAGHFIGPDSVIAQLRRRGLKVSRVQ